MQHVKAMSAMKWHFRKNWTWNGIKWAQMQEFPLDFSWIYMQIWLELSCWNGLTSSHIGVKDPLWLPFDRLQNRSQWSFIIMPFFCQNRSKKKFLLEGKSSLETPFWVKMPQNTPLWLEYINKNYKDMNGSKIIPYHYPSTSVPNS